MGDEFDPTDYTPEKTLIRIAELRVHLRTDLMPMAARREDAAFWTLLLNYLDVLAARFEEWVNAPLDVLAFVVRNLLEYSALLRSALDSEERRAVLANEALLDVQDLDRKSSRMFADAGVDPPARSRGAGEVNWQVFTEERIVGRRDSFDSWVFKLCSKVMHPTAIRILVPDALMGPPKRLTLLFAGANYLALCYNLLSDAVLPATHLRVAAPEGLGDVRIVTEGDPAWTREDQRRRHEETFGEFEDMCLMDSAEAILRVRREVDKWSEDIVKHLVDAQIHTWNTAHHPPGREPDPSSSRLCLAEELHRAVLERLSRPPSSDPGSSPDGGDH